MPIIRTPDERFTDLPDFAYDPRYVEIDELRVHYVDVGQPDKGRSDVILCLHGEPTWSFLHRKMIPPLSADHRVVAMDFVGFGRSDKLTEREEYSFQMHYDTLAGFVRALGLEAITLVVQDWGGLLGLTLAAKMPERIARLVIMNTGLPTGDGPIGDAFLQWRRFVEMTSDLPIGRIIRMGLVHGDEVPPEVIAAYEAPFPDFTYKSGAAAWPLLVPIHPNDPGAAEMRQARTALSQWKKPALVMFSDGDPITRGGDRFFRALIPSAKDQPEIVIKDAGHFLQEEKGEEIAQHILDFIARAPMG